MTTAGAEMFSQLECMQLGGPFRIVQVPKGAPGPDEVYIRQRFISLNQADVKWRDWGTGSTDWPRVIGIEGAGVIEAIGSEVRDLQPGDEVAAWCSGTNKLSWAGAYKEYVSVPACMVVKKPQNISLGEAASLPICFATAVTTIVYSLEVPLPFLHGTSTEGQAPTSVLILGGSSGTGSAAIQLMRRAYPSLSIITTSSAKHKARLLDLGATHIVDYKSPSIVDEIKSLSPGAAGVDAIIDTVSGGASQPDICDVFDPAGSKRYAAVVTGAPVSVPDGVKKTDAGAWSMFDMEGGRELLPSLTKLIEDGLYKVPMPVKVVGHGLAEIPDVMDQTMTASGEKLLVTL